MSRILVNMLAKAGYVALTALLCAFCVLIPQPSQASTPSPWTTSTPAATVSASIASTVADAHGNFTAVSVDTSFHPARIVATERTSRSSWSASTPISDPTVRSTDPHITVDAHGTVTAVWASGDDGSNRIVVARKAPGGAWSAPVTVVDNLYRATQLGIAGNSSGDVAITWCHISSDWSTHTIHSAISYSGGDWHLSPTIGQSGDQFDDPVVAVGPNGTLFQVWREGASYLMARTQAPGSAPGVANRITPISEGVTNYVTATSDRHGNAMVTWINSVAELRAERINPRLTLESPATLSAAGQYADLPQVAATPDGTVTAMWAEESANVYRIMVGTRKEADASWGTAAPETALASNGVSQLTMGINDSGQAEAIWERVSDSDTRSIVAGRYLPGLGWQTPIILSDEANGYDATISFPISIDPAGDADAVWLSSERMTLQVGAIVEADVTTTISVRYDTNRGLGQTPSVGHHVTGDSPLVVASGRGIVRPGFTFDGWNTAPDGSGIHYSAGTTINPTDDVTLYAQWKLASLSNTGASTSANVFAGALLLLLGLGLSSALLLLRRVKP